MKWENNLRELLMEYCHQSNYNFPFSHMYRLVHRGLIGLQCVSLRLHWFLAYPCIPESFVSLSSPQHDFRVAQMKAAMADHRLAHSFVRDGKCSSLKNGPISILPKSWQPTQILIALCQWAAGNFISMHSGWIEFPRPLFLNSICIAQSIIAGWQNLLPSRGPIDYRGIRRRRIWGRRPGHFLVILRIWNGEMAKRIDQMDQWKEWKIPRGFLKEWAQRNWPGSISHGRWDGWGQQREAGSHRRLAESKSSWPVGRLLCFSFHF